LYRSFTLERQARTAKIHEWSADSVGALADRIGLKGSRTQVCRIFSPTDERAKTCLMVNRPDELVELIRERYRAAEPAARQGDGEQYRLNGREPEYRGEFWVFAEREGDGIRSVSLELLGKARQLAGCLGERVAAVLACDRAHDLPRILFAHGAEVVYTIEHPLLAEFHPITYKKAVAAAVRRGKPQAMFFGATPLGRELAPRVAYACDCGLTADCTKLEIGDLEKGGLAHVGILKQTRPALGGNIMATIITRASATQMATVRPGVFRIPAPDPDRVGEIVAVAADLSPDDVAVETVTRESFGAEDSIRDAEVIVAGGRGLRSRSDFERHLQPLADGLSQLLDCRAEIGASRMAVEDGYVGHDHQVGQTGQTVQPRLYVAVGISGAVQHISGMQNSDIVVAINRDPRARIFSVADFGMVGDVEAILPDLVNAVGGARSDRSTH
jgi:electron transfer flavoprotein alpha subunit